MSASTSSKTFCVIPWIHLNIMPAGRVYHCCQMTHTDDVLGQLGEQSLEDIWNGEKLRQIRMQMLNGEVPSACSSCLKDEAARGGSGTRTRHNENFAHRIPAIADETGPDGRVETMTLAYWDFRFSNICQLKCRTCGPDYSSSWIPDAREIGAELGFKPSQSTSKVFELKQVSGRENVEFLRRHIHQVETVYFAGGEPLLMDEHWEILDMLEAAGRSDVVLAYNSNFGKLEYRGRNVLDYWARWQGNVYVQPSLDEVGERAELIRSGTRWKSLEANLIAARKAGIDLNPNITVSALNVHRLPEIIEYLLAIDVVLVEHDYDKSFYLNFNMVYSPRYYHVGVLPQSQRMAIIERLHGYIEYARQQHGAEVHRQFLPVIAALENAADQADVDLFIKHTKVLDRHRGENTAAVLPELADLLK